MEEFRYFARVSDAPRELVWKVCTEPEHMQQLVWTKEDLLDAPSKMDFRPGGIYHYSLKGPNGARKCGANFYIARSCRRNELSSLTPSRTNWLG